MTGSDGRQRGRQAQGAYRRPVTSQAKMLRVELLHVKVEWDTASALDSTDGRCPALPLLRRRECPDAALLWVVRDATRACVPVVRGRQ